MNNLSDWFFFEITFLNLFTGTVIQSVSRFLDKWSVGPDLEFASLLGVLFPFCFIFLFCLKSYYSRQESKSINFKIVQMFQNAGFQELAFIHLFFLS